MLHLTGFIYLSSFGLLSRASSQDDDFNIRSKILTSKLLKQGIGITNSAFKLKSFRKQGIWEPEFYGDLVYKFRNQRTIGPVSLI